MREAAFINKNRERWVRFETSLSKAGIISPDELSDLYLQVVNDLGYSQTYYPNSKTTEYLNSLAVKAHFFIYKNKKEKTNRIISFWKYELPLLFADYQKELLLSFIIFLLSGVIGFFSVYQNIEFVRLILGDDYVDMTLANIRNGDPMAVYHGTPAFIMFIEITMNNIGVGFKVFILGLLTPILPVFILFYNGVMIGTFDAFLISQGEGVRGNSIIWIHGVFEIFVIIVCGAAGLVLGKSVLFPGTYTRLRSIQKGFGNGLKICFSTLPFFICAGFLESYVSRHSLMPLGLAICIIIISVVIIVYYYIIYPNKLKRKIRNEFRETKN